MPCGNINAYFVQLLEPQRLGDVAMIVLVENKTDQCRAEVAVLHIWPQLARYITAVGGFIHLESIAGIARLYYEILNHPILMVFESRTRRNKFRLNGLGVVDFKFGGFMSFRRAGPFSFGCLLFFGTFFSQTAGLNFGPGRLIF